LIGGLINWGANGFQFNAQGLNYFLTGGLAGWTAIYPEFGGWVVSAAILGGGNSLNKQLSEKGKVDGLELFGDIVTGIAIAGATMGIYKEVSTIITPVARPPVIAIKNLTPVGIDTTGQAILSAESTITSQATETTLANTAAQTTANTSKELAKSGIKVVTDGAKNFNCTNCALNIDKVAAKGGGSLIAKGLGSTGRTVAGNLTEQLAMKEIVSNPAMGRVIKIGLKDARWSGWSKMAWNNAGVEIHYVGQWQNGVLKAVDDFKFITK
jgi:hypothetical protein